MPRYRFNIIGGQKIFDPTDVRLVNDEAAEQEAKNFARTVRKSPLGMQSEAIEVVDEHGHKIYSVPVHKRENEQE
jgi:hypothetical protein